VIYSRIKILP